jgi:predicted nuclease of predicted toxin-antitoxin system
MKFFIDAQLPLRLAKCLRDRGYDVLHTRELPDQNATPDRVINELSIAQERIVITKDSDFLESFLLKQQPYKLLLVTTGNIKNSELESLFLNNLTQLIDLFEQYSYLELSRDRLVVHQ